MPSKKQRKGGATTGGKGKTSTTKEEFHEQPSDAERAKLRPVLELLDEQKPRLALKAVDGVLKRWPGSLRAQTLRALCLARLGDAAASVAAAERVIAHSPRDPELLNLLLLVLRPAGLAARVTPLYAAAWQHASGPAAEAVGEALFLCHVRDRDYAAQQQLVGTLAARFPRARAPFLWWRVASLYAQAHLAHAPSGSASSSTASSSTAPAPDARLLGLCEVLAARLLADGKMRAAGEAELYVAVLRDLHRDARLLELLEGKGESDAEIAARPPTTVAALLPRNVERLEAVAEAHEHLAQWARACAVYAALLRMPAAHRNWRHFQGLVRCACADPATLPTVRAALAELHTARVERGVLLAELELETRLAGAGGDTERMRRRLCQYAEHVCTKPACAVDLRPYLRELIVARGVGPADLVAQLREACKCPPLPGGQEGGAKGEEQLPLQDLCKQAFFFAVERIAGVHERLEVTRLEETLRAMLRVYTAVLEREKVQDGAPSAADELAVVAAATFEDVATRAGTEAVLFEAAAFLEEVLARTPNNAQARLALVRVHARLGALDCALAHYERAYMGVKGVLHESCAHLVVHDAAVAHCNAGGAGARLLAHVLRVHHENATQVPEQVVQGVVAGAYVQAVEIARFHGRLRRSALQRYALVERCLAQCLSLAPADYRAACAGLQGLPALPGALADLDCTTSDTRASILVDLAPVGSAEDASGACGPDAPAPRPTPPFLTREAIGLREAAARVLVAASSASADLPQTVRDLDAALGAALPETSTGSSSSLAEAIAATDLGDAEKVERHCWHLFASAAHYVVLALANPDEKKEKEGEIDAKAKALEEAMQAMGAMVARAAEEADRVLAHTDFRACCRSLAAVVTQGVCWCSVLLVAAAARLGTQRHAAALRGTLVTVAAALHGRALPALAQRVCRDPAGAAAVNALFADAAHGHLPAGFVAPEAAADRVAAVREARGASLVAYIQSMSGLVAASF